MSPKILFSIICISLLSANIPADVPNVVNYQGRLTEASGDPVADDAYLVKFIIYDDPIAGAEIWNSNFQTINTSNGLFTYLLGSNETLPVGIFSDTNRYLALTLGTNPESTPRSQFNTVSYAFEAQNASDADSLGGLDPSFYLDWDNLTNVPPAFDDDTLDSWEILDEPGIAANRWGGTIVLSQTTTVMTDLRTVTISIPAPGYIVVNGHTDLHLRGTTGRNQVKLQIDETIGGSAVGSYDSHTGFEAAPNTSTIYYSADVSRIYFKFEGQYTFRLEAVAHHLNNGDAVSECGGPTIVATYFPTSYGFVSTVGQDPPADIESQLIEITNPDGSTEQTYQYDLRDLELRAKEARLKAQEAELELLKAKQQGASGR
ncbi:MAG: hypothetical protein OEV49_15560 [candidate division Zixibacteria bacterium]|nr:hypothetical protein [candidate division Zixibacteria bacterium]MDH3938500.1 hypothetical protein [candidate division Zixibacteria bacterium]MDH4035761.1 hypothetical protein [candidate division Zixibacteria bacterium]